MIDRPDSRHGKRAGIILILSVLFFICPFSSGAQRYPFFNIGIEQGLIQSQVFTLAQDHNGHLWAGTLGGLSCYDGRSFRSFTVRDGLPSNTIIWLHCDKKGLLWIGTARGLSCYDGHSFRNYLFSGADDPGENKVARVSVLPDGTVWCIAGRDLYRIRDGKAAPVPLPQGYTDASALLAGSRGDVWVGIPGATALYRFKGEHWDSTALPRHVFVHRIYEDRKDRLVLLTSAGCYRRDAAGAWDLLMERTSAKDPILYSFAEARDSSYWLSTTAGVIQLSGDKKQWYTKHNGLTDVLVYDILSDREGNIWLASNGEGLFRFSGATFTAVDERMGLTGPQVSSIARDEDGVVYFGSYDGGLYRYKDGIVKPLPFPEAGMRRPVASLAIYDHTLWIGTQGIGLWQYDLRTGRMSRYADERLGYAVLAMQADSAGLWMGAGKGIARLSGDSLKTIPVPAGAVESFTRIGRDSLLLATMEGLMLYHDGSVRPFSTHTTADSAQIVCMDYRAGTLWLGTVDDGVFGCRLSNRQTVHINRSNGLRSDFIYNIYAAPDGFVWAGTGYGICRIKPDGVRASVTFYGRSAGINGMESNRNAVLPLGDGSIWFGTTGGAFLYHPSDATAITQPVSIQLQRVQLFGESVRDTAWYNGTSALYGAPLDLRLPWRQNNLTFSFSAISLTGNEGIYYRYRLDGLNAPWSMWSTNNTVTFSALPPGKYVLVVQSSIDGNTAQAQSLRYAFEIITPFHKTTWFRLLILAGCIALGVAIQYIAAHRKRTRMAMIEALRREEQAKVRQRTAEDFHDEVGNKLTRINVLTNVLRSKVGAAAPEATRIIDQIQDNAGQLYSGTRDILWSLQPSNDSLYQVLQRIRDFGRDLFGDTEISFDMEGIESAWREYRLPMDMSRNLIMIFKEALNNALKYAMADKVHIRASSAAGHLTLKLTDDGKGFDPAHITRGQGLVNMQTRAERLGGTLRIATACGQGTNIELNLKIPQKKG
jgi:signal transduction histidine kinase/ligand-binding sensor domain-containing protein